MSLSYTSDSLHEAVNEGNVDSVMEHLKRGVNVNILSSSGRSHLCRAAQMGNVAAVCILLDADKFYSTPEEEKISPGEKFFLSESSTQNTFDNFSCMKNYLNSTNKHVHKCCSPSIDSETFNCSDEVWSQECSDSNTGQQSDLELSTNPREKMYPLKRSVSSRQTSPVNAVEKTSESQISSSAPGSFSSAVSTYTPLTSYTGPHHTSSNIGYCVYREEEEQKEDTEESSGPILSSTEDSDSALFDHKQPEQPSHRQTNLLMHRAIGRGRSAIVSSDSEFETENYHRRRHNKHNHHRAHRHDRDTGRVKVFVPSTHSSNPFFAQLHREYLNLGLSSPWLQRRSCDLNQRDAYGRTALHYATEQGHAYIVSVLIKAGAKVDAIDAEHMTALHLAAQRGFTEIVSLLIENGAKVNNKMNDKSSPLHIAASRGYTDIVETLLDRGAKIDSLDSSDRTPLLLAVSRAHYKVAQLLIRRGAKVNIEEIHGYTPLCEAVWQKELKLVQMLIKAKAKVTQSHYLLHYAVLHRHYQLVEVLLAARCVVNLRDDKGDTPLIIAARGCHAAIIERLLKHGANVNYPNGLTGSRPLHEAVEGTRDAQFEDFLVVFKLLTSHGAKLDVETVTEGDTPLYRALFFEKNKAAAILIREGCCVNKKPPGSFPDYLNIAASRSNSSLCCLIILAGFKISRVAWLSAKHPPGSLLAHLGKIKSRPLSLADQCRIFIRRRLGENVVGSIMTSTLPTKVKRFLLLKDIKGIDI